VRPQFPTPPSLPPPPSPPPHCRGPFTVIGGDTADDNAATLQCEPDLDPHIFSPAAASLLAGLLCKDPASRLGCGGAGVREVMAHPFFAGVDWVAMEHKQVPPPFKPAVNVLESAKTVRGWSDKDRAKLEAVALGSSDQVCVCVGGGGGGAVVERGA
jgi:serine/threonine protein kinase